MDTNRIKQFCTIVATGNLRKASDLLGISHSGLSKSMRVLEAEIGFPLFIPNGRGIVISDEGMRLYKRAPSFLAEWDRLLGKSTPRQHDLIRIGSSEVFTCYFTGTLLKQYLRNSEVEVHELVPGRLEEALILDRIDIGITYDPLPRQGIEYIKIRSILLGAYKRRGAFPDQGILEIPFVVQLKPQEAVLSGAKGLDGWPIDRFKRNERYRVDLLSTGLELVRQGLCAIFIPRFVAEHHNHSIRPELRLERLCPPEGMSEIKRDVTIVKRESTTENKTIQQIAKALRTLD